MKTYKDEARERWGGTQAWREFEERSGPQEDAAAGLMALFAALGGKKQLPPESEEAQQAVEEIRRYISAHYYDCTDEILAGLGEMYVADDRFRNNIDRAGGAGTAAFARAVIRARGNLR